MLERGIESDNFRDQTFSLPPRYGSNPERVCAEAFEKWIPGWRPINGETVQVSIGAGKRIDFLIHDTFVEFHPIYIIRELKSSRANTDFKHLYRKLPHWGRDKLVDLLTEELEAQYAHRRQQLISISHHADKHLLVVKNPWEVWRSVIKQYGDPAPKWDEFRRFWHDAIRNKGQ